MSTPIAQPSAIEEQAFGRDSAKPIAQDRNFEWFERANQVIPGGVNSPVRAFRQVGGTPLFIEKAQGAWLWDANGNRYIDYIGSWGAMIVGHSNSYVVEKVKKSLDNGFSFGTPTALEVELAERIGQFYPSMEMIRLVSSGTEATMSALRLARGFTGRKMVVKFEGCYHGHVDSLLVKAGSGLLTLGSPNSAGVPPEVTQDTLVLPYHDMSALQAAFDQYGPDIAAVIIEPIAGNMNLIVPSQAYHDLLRQLCTKAGALLIFDEVMTGFRVSMGGAQAHYGIVPDLTCLGKVIGGGMPIGAFGGRREIMAHMAPIGAVYQAGTLSGNPVAVTCGLATLDLLAQPAFFPQVEAQTKKLAKALNDLGHSLNVPFCAQAIGSMFGFYFADHIPTEYNQVVQSDIERFKRFFHAMLARGIYLAPSAFEAGFVSIDHDDNIIEQTVIAAKESLCEVF